MSAPPIWRLRTPRGELAVWAGWLLGLAVTIAGFQHISERTIWAFVWDAPVQAADILGRAVPPRWAYAGQLWRPLWDTINIATLGTGLAVLLGVPVAFLAAHNTTPSTLMVRPAMLFIIVASRSINSLIWALVLVIVLGPGTLAGILSIALRSIGFIGKLLYEAIEEIDARQVEAVEATGAARAQVLAWAIAPQVAPSFAGIVVFRWDINIREATVLGLVGAGGIGMQLQSSINVLAWPQVTLILLMILGTVLLAEWVSARVRHAVI
jgi:phosphonate transport system permease protein